MLSRKFLRQLTPAVVKKVLEERARLVKTERLAARRQKLMTALALVEREMSKLNGEPARRRGPRKLPKFSMPGRRKGFKLSAETRRKMSESAKRRYAGNGKAETSASGKSQRKPMSPETRAKMADAARRRWAKVKGAEEK